MGRGNDARWTATFAAASRLAPAAAWRESVARALREAASAELVLAVTCPPGDWGEHFQATTYPDAYGGLMASISERFLPRIEQAGEGFSDAVRRHGLVYAPLEVARLRPLAEEMRESLLAPADMRGWVVTSIVDGAGDLIGVLALGTRTEAAVVLDRMAQRLAEVSTIAARTLEGAIQLAAGCQPRRALPTARLALLSAREREVAGLVAEGLRNANVAARLGIAEATVAVHLKRIYGKLGVGSRLDLAILCRP